MRWLEHERLPRGMQQHENPFCREAKRKPGKDCLRDCVYELAEQCLASRGRNGYRCHAGAEELRFPIREDGQLGAVLYIGPFTTGNVAGLRALSPAEVDRAELFGALLADHVLAGKRAWTEHDQQAPPSPHAAIERFLKQNLPYDPKRKDLAAALHVSENWISHFVRQQAGQSFQQMKDRLRIEVACQLLYDTDLKVESVAHASGFQNVSYFYRFFQRKLGTTPGTFRRRRKRPPSSP